MICILSLCQDGTKASYEEVSTYIVDNVIGDTWSDAGMSEVLEYLYANKSLTLTDAQRRMIRGLAELWD